MLNYLRTIVRAFAITLVAVVIAIAAFVAFRVVSAGQVDDDARLAAKQQYLSGIGAMAAGIRGRPNVIFILYDDMGYGDIGVGAIGSDLIHTPRIDQLAANGVMLSDFHSPASVCSPSRAGFLTGRLPPHAGMTSVLFPDGSIKEFIFSILLNPAANVRLPAEEITLGDIFKAAGYRTAMVGKWHLGDRSPSLPNDFGFDTFFGALYSNDMVPFALYRDQSVVVPAPVDQRELSEHYAIESTQFIRDAQEQPFFLYLAHNFPHDPLSVSAQRSGQSDAGLYGDVLEELDHGVGRVVDALRDTGQLDNTLIIISSDNGPWFLGNAGDHRGRKGNTFEGGTRVPFIAHWPDGFPGGRVEAAMAMGTDLLPTVLDLLGLPAPQDRELDGRSILPVLQTGADTPHDYLFYHDGAELMAVRDARFKYRGPAGVHYGTDIMPIAMSVRQKEWLFDLERDPRESYDTATRHPERLAQLRKVFEARQKALKENPRAWRE